MNKIDELFGIDPIYLVEKVTGTSASSNIELALGLQLMKNDLLSKALEEAGDVDSFRQDLSQYISTLERGGFKQGLVMDVPRTRDKFYIYWRDGIIIAFDSYRDNTVVNGGSMYLNYQFDRNSEDGWGALSGCSHGPLRGKVEEGDIITRQVSKDCRQGLFNTLNKMQTGGTILPTWKQSPFLWFLHYMDTKVDGYDYNEINRERISLLPKEVQLVIGSY